MQQPFAGFDDRVSDVATAAERLALIPFTAALGLQVTDIGDGAGVMRLAGPTATEPAAIAGVLDQAGSVAIWGRYGLGLPHATVSLSFSFLGTPDGTPLQIDAAVTSVWNGLANTFVTARQEATGTPIAQGMVNYALGSFPGGQQGDRTAAYDYGGEVPAGPTDSDIGRWLGLSLKDGYGSFPLEEQAIGSRDPRALHGGAIAAALILAAEDLAGPASAWALSQVTVDYLRAGSQGDTAVAAELVHRGRKATALSARATQLAGSRHVANAALRFIAPTES